MYKYDVNTNTWIEQLSGNVIDVSALGDSGYYTFLLYDNGFSNQIKGGNYYSVGIKQYIDTSQFIGIG